jgi:membrane-associated phospholipid phosphatase
MSQPFAALPPRSEYANLALLTAAFAAWFGLCYGGAAALAPQIPWRVDVQLPLDTRLPFWPGAAALYLTITPMLLLAPFVLRDLRSLLPLFAALMLETSIAVVGFLLLPIDDAPVSCAGESLACAIFRLADALNLHHNNLPSLHVAFAATLALAFAPRAGKLGTALLYVWVLAVSASTLFTRQHFLADVLAGLVLAAIAWRVAGSWARRPEVQAAFDVELLVLRTLASFVPRHRRYLAGGIAVLAAGIPHWRRQRLVRVGFAFLQALDDILDGDRPCDREPLEVAEEMAASLRSGEFGDHDLARLGAAYRADLLARAGQRGIDDSLALIGTLQRDRRRVLERTVSSREELRDIPRATFADSVDILLHAAASPLRHDDVPLLLDALGWCSTVRDLREDLAQGLINIPEDVFTRATAERPHVPLPLLAETQAVRNWLEQERQRAPALLDAVDAQIAALPAHRGKKALRRFARSMRRYTR